MYYGCAVSRSATVTNTMAASGTTYSPVEMQSTASSSACFNLSDSWFYAIPYQIAFLRYYHKKKKTNDPARIEKKLNIDTAFDEKNTIIMIWRWHQTVAEALQCCWSHWWSVVGLGYESQPATKMFSYLYQQFAVYAQGKNRRQLPHCTSGGKNVGWD